MKAFTPNNLLCERPSIPEGLCPSAQGWEARATLGKGGQKVSTPTGLCLYAHGRGLNPVGVEDSFATLSQGSSFLTTLGFEPESRWDSSALQPLHFP